MTIRIPQIVPYFDHLEEKYLLETMASTWLVEHDRTRELEAFFMDYMGASHAVMCSNGTVALTMSLLAAGIGSISTEGSATDEVIIPDMTFIASANAVLSVGARPVVVDVGDDLHMDVSLVGRALTSNTKAIMPVHLYGESVEMEPLMELARVNNLVVIEDAAQAVGVRNSGDHVGSIGRFGTFSFYGNKTLTCGEGGMVLCRSQEDRDRLYRIKHHGVIGKGSFVHEEIGFNYCFTDVQAAILLAQCKKIDQILGGKKKVFSRYLEGLKDVTGCQVIKSRSEVESSKWCTNIVVDDAARLQEALLKEGVQTRRIFYPLHWQPCYKPTNIPIKFQGPFSSTEKLYRTTLSLPSSVSLSEQSQSLVIESIKKAL